MTDQAKIDKIHPPLTEEALSQVDRFIFPAINKIRATFSPLAEDNDCERELSLVLNAAHAVPSLAKEVRAARSAPLPSVVGAAAECVYVPSKVVEAATEAGRARFPEWATNPDHGRAANAYSQGYLERFRQTAAAASIGGGGREFELVLERLKSHKSILEFNRTVATPGLELAINIVGGMAKDAASIPVVEQPSEPYAFVLSSRNKLQSEVYALRQQLKAVTGGAALIAVERQEQIHKHGFDVSHDADYGQGELVQAAGAALLLYVNDADIPASHPRDVSSAWPWQSDFGMSFFEKIKHKSNTDKLKVAGALIAAEIDRLLGHAPAASPIPIGEEAAQSDSQYVGPADEPDFIAPGFEMSDHAAAHWFGKDAAAEMKKGADTDGK